MPIIKDNWRFSNEEVKLITKVIKSGESSSMTGSANKIFEDSFAKKVGAKKMGQCPQHPPWQPTQPRQLGILASHMRIDTSFLLYVNIS